MPEPYGPYKPPTFKPVQTFEAFEAEKRPEYEADYETKR